jgi:transcriptional regulator
MYVPRYYSVSDGDEIIRFLHEFSFGILITSENNIPVATHIPFLVFEKEKKLFLQGHIASVNPQVEQLKNSPEALCIFSSSHHYVSSSWYNHPNVSTWNYQSVHVYGNVRIISQEELLSQVTAMQHLHEKNNAHPVEVENLPQKLIDGYLKQITGFEIAVKDLQAKYKLSQNRNEKDYESVIDHLKKINDPDAKSVAEEMERIKKKK